MVAKKPDVVQRFVDASTIGWYQLSLWRQQSRQRLIKKDNPEMTDDQIASRISQDEGIWPRRFRRYAEDGHRRDDRRARKKFYDKMVKAGVVEPDLDYKKAYTLQFVNKGVGSISGRNDA